MGSCCSVEEVDIKTPLLPEEKVYSTFDATNYSTVSGRSDNDTVKELRGKRGVQEIQRVIEQKLICCLPTCMACGGTFVANEQPPKFINRHRYHFDCAPGMPVERRVPKVASALPCDVALTNSQKMVLRVVVDDAEKANSSKAYTFFLQRATTEHRKSENEDNRVEEAMYPRKIRFIAEATHSSGVAKRLATPFIPGTQAVVVVQDLTGSFGAAEAIQQQSDKDDGHFYIAELFRLGHHVAQTLRVVVDLTKDRLCLSAITLELRRHEDSVYKDSVNEETDKLYTENRGPSGAGTGKEPCFDEENANDGARVDNGTRTRLVEGIEPKMMEGGVEDLSEAPTAVQPSSVLVNKSRTGRLWRLAARLTTKKDGSKRYLSPIKIIRKTKKT